MFNAQVGGQIAWLLPLAAVSLGAGLWLTRRRPRTDLARAGWVLFGTWAVVDAIVFSFQKGGFHPYYASALAPAVAALAGGGLVVLVRWAARSAAGTAALTVGIGASALEAMSLLGGYAPAVRILIPVAAVVAIAGLLMPTRTLRRVGAVAAVVAVLAGPATWSLATVGKSLDGNNVTGGPVSASFGGGGPGGFGGDGGSTDTALVRYLEQHQGSAKYLVAAVSSHTTAGMIIATGKPVVTIGGFNGSDPAPTVAQLAAMVKAGELRYVMLSGGMGGGPGGLRSSSAISAWVQAHGTEVPGMSGLYAVHA
jgi:4-amino-4-deoxy-L-arabinose transferase-like glycosyltransferase